MRAFDVQFTANIGNVLGLHNSFSFELPKLNFSHREVRAKFRILQDRCRPGPTYLDYTQSIICYYYESSYVTYYVVGSLMMHIKYRIYYILLHEYLDNLSLSINQIFYENPLTT